MDFDFYVRVRTCKKRVTGKQPLGNSNVATFVFSNVHFEPCNYSFKTVRVLKVIYFEQE